MRRLTALLLTAAAGLLAACAGAPGGMQRALVPAYATGAGLGEASPPTSAAPPAAPVHDQGARAERSHAH